MGGGHEQIGGASAWHVAVINVTFFALTVRRRAGRQATVLSYRELDLAYLRKNWGIVVAVGTLYLSFILGIAFLRLRRTRESLLYLK
jgi:hypothetical protein